jgi:hypothetical protein
MRATGSNARMTITDWRLGLPGQTGPKQFMFRVQSPNVVLERNDCRRVFSARLRCYLLHFPALS